MTLREMQQEAAEYLYRYRIAKAEVKDISEEIGAEDVILSEDAGAGEAALNPDQMKKFNQDKIKNSTEKKPTTKKNALEKKQII